MNFMITLIDGVEMAKKHPATFTVPTAADIAATEPGDYVKLGFRHSVTGVTERMWVLLHTQTSGELNNDPFLLEEIECGDPVEFEDRHVLQIMKKGDF